MVAAPRGEAGRGVNSDKSSRSSEPAVEALTEALQCGDLVLQGPDGSSDVGRGVMNKGFGPSPESDDGRTVT
jgi:hypothetical protein